MKIKAMKSLGDSEPVVLDGFTFVVIERDGTPIVVAMDLGPEMGDAAYVGHVRDPDFNTMLEQLGVDKTVIVEDGKKILYPDSVSPAEKLAAVARGA